MDPRDRFLKVIGFEEPDRAPLGFHSPGWEIRYNVFWKGARWILPPDTPADEYFGYDLWVKLPSGVFGPVPAFPHRILEETDRYQVIVDGTGTTRKIFKDPSFLGGYAGMPQWLDFPVKTRDDFEEMKTRFDPHSPGRYGLHVFNNHRTSDSIVRKIQESCKDTDSPEAQRELIRKVVDSARVPVGLDVPGLFFQARNLMGLERLLVTFHRDPRFIEEIFDFWTDFVIETMKAAIDVRLDYVVLPEDMSYNKGSFISIKHFTEFFVPRYKRITQYLRSRGVQVIFVDSDGNCEQLISGWLEAGINGVFPLEVRAGMDAVELRKEYGDELILAGNIDKNALAEGPKKIEEEVQLKLPSLLQEGGYLISLDHGVPPNVSLQNYQHYLGLVRKASQYPSRISYS